jgi:putative effector of murein hydrolase LrgA (UPF0299 family)
MNSIKKAGPWALPAVLTAVAIVWAVAAIGDILTAQAHPAFAYSVAVLYDAVWLYALAQETAHRRQGSNTRLPKAIGWVFLPLTVAILAVHGLLAADVLAAAVGGLVPVLAKVTLVMAIDRDRTRISPRAQSAIDRTRAATRDRIAVSRALAAARADETRAAAEIIEHARKAEAEATVTTYEALEAHAEIIDRHPVPDWHTTLPALVSDRELEALLAGGVPDEETAGGTGGFALTETTVPVTPCQSGTPSLEGPQNANLRAVAMLAAELYATDPPPSKRKFREAMREAMRARGLTGGWDVVDALYDREKALAEGGETS